MHFWIDKRSQACGFGRARVSASLSGAGSGVGLGFAHPPRRIGGNKLFSTVPSIHRQQHGQQQHHHNHHHQQQQQQSAPYSNSSSVITTTADCHARSYNQQHGVINNNNIAAHNSSNIYAQHQQQQQIQPLATQQQSLTQNMNNNAHQQQQQILQRQQQQQQQQQQQHISTCNINVGSNIGNYNMLNNNNNNNTSNTSNLAQLPPTTSSANVSSATAAVLTGAGTIVPVTTSNTNGRYARHQYRSAQHPVINQMSNHAAHHHYDTRSYHHPQFGNMSVRHYQCGDSNATQMNAAATTAPSTTLQQTSNPRAIGNHPQFNALGSNSGQVTTVAASSAMPLHECRSGVMQQQQQNLHSPLQHVCGGIPHAEGIDAAGTMVLGPIHTRTLHSHQHAATHRNISSGNMRATITHNGIIDDVETQPILTQLKCGMWASLVLISVFVAGAKFYFDNQGTGLEVIIFCAFSATFFLAACTVSLCRLPKGLVSARHMGDSNNRALVPCNQASFGANGSTVPAADNTHNHIFGQSNEQRLNELQERTAAAQAGPPPYHIAILLPEHSKDAATDESPPPSYDKILI